MQFPRHSPSTCISTMYVNMRSMHKHTKSCVNVLLPNEHNDVGTHIHAMYVCAVCSTDENQETSPTDPFHVAVGPITRAKRIDEAFNGLI